MAAWTFRPIKDYVAETAMISTGAFLGAMGLMQTFNAKAVVVVAGLTLLPRAIEKATSVIPTNANPITHHPDCPPAIAATIERTYTDIVTRYGLAYTPNLDLAHDVQTLGAENPITGDISLDKTFVQDHPQHAGFFLGHELSHLISDTGMPRMLNNTAIFTSASLGALGFCTAAKSLAFSEPVQGMILNAPSLSHTVMAAIGVGSSIVLARHANRISERRHDKNGLYVSGDKDAFGIISSKIPPKGPLAQFLYDHDSPQTRVKIIERVWPSIQAQREADGLMPTARTGITVPVLA